MIHRTDADKFLLHPCLQCVYHSMNNEFVYDMTLDQMYISSHTSIRFELELPYVW